MPVTLHISGGAEWDRIALTLERFEDNIQNARPAFEEMAEVFRASMLTQFTAQGAHTGPKWAPLSPRYAAWKARRYPGKPIMELTGALKRSLTQRPFGVEVITARGMRVGTDIDYARYHQKGTPIMPKRELIGPPTMTENRVYAKILQGWIVERNVRAY